MGVSYVNKHWSGTTGGRELLGKRQYTAVYKVVTDSYQDQTQVIIEHFQNAGNLPRLGTPYVYENDRDDNVICTAIRPRREGKSSTVWEVTLTYETLDGDKNDKEQKPDSDGNLTDDPTRWLDDINVGFMQISVPVEGAVYCGGFTGTAARLVPIGAFGPVMNSAFITFVPPPEEELKIAVVRRSYYYVTYSQDLANLYIGKVNDNRLSISRLGYQGIWNEFTAKIVNIGGSLEFINGRVWWRNSIEVHIHPMGWRRNIVDRGLHARAMANDPDGRGGFISGSSSDVVAGVPAVRRVVDAAGVPISEPVLFNGDGAPLNNAGEDFLRDPVDLLYATCPEIHFPDDIMGN